MPWPLREHGYRYQCWNTEQFDAKEGFVLLNGRAHIDAQRSYPAKLDYVGHSQS